MNIGDEVAKGADAVPQGAIVVGITGDNLDDTCLAWAAAAASRTGRPLHLLHARPEPATYLPLTTFSGLEPSMILPLTPDLDAEDSILRDVVLRARRKWPDLAITGSKPFGRRERVLVEASERAYLIVVGAPERHGLHRFQERPSLAAAMHAACPVVIVPHGVRVEPQGPIIAAVDGSEPSRHALERAFAVARTRGERLLVITAWLLESVAGLVVGEYDTRAWAALEDEYRSMAQAMVDPLARDYPTVDVEVRTIRGDPAQVITGLSGEAGLLVLGSRGRGGFRGMLLGSVTHEVIERATCPVLIVRDTPQER